MPVAPEPQQPQLIEVDTSVVTPDFAFGIAEVMEQGRQALGADDCRTAIAHFDKALRLDPEGRDASEALYRSATTYEACLEHREAALRFEQFARRFPEHPDQLGARVGALRLWVFLDEWARAGQLAQGLASEEAQLTPQALVAVHSARALAALDQGQFERAEYHVTKGRVLVERYGLDRLAVYPRDLAQLYFALGETRRIRSEAIAFNPLPRDFASRFEARAQLLLDAQGAYLDVMRARDAHWSAMAGFRLGELYGGLHSAVMAAPQPPAVPADRAELFEGAKRLRYVVLLRKGLEVLDSTLRMAQRTDERSRWVELAQLRRDELAAQLDREEALLDALPYARADLRRLLDEIAAIQSH